MDTSKSTVPRAARPCLETFALFPKLPPELRIAIFRFAMTESRVVVLEPRYAELQQAEPAEPQQAEPAEPQQAEPAEPRVGTSLGDHLVASPPPRRTTNTPARSSWYSRTQIPPLLHVNYEARQEALKDYQLAFGTDGTSPKTYVDFSRDTIFLGESATTPEALQMLRVTPDLPKSQTLALEPESLWRTLSCIDPENHRLEKVIVAQVPEERELGRLPQLDEDRPEESDTADMEARLGVSETDAADLPREWDTKQDMHEKVPHGSLECFMTKYQHNHSDPERQRMDEGREEFRTAMDMQLTPWPREPMLATGRIRSGEAASDQTRVSLQPRVRRRG